MPAKPQIPNAILPWIRFWAIALLLVAIALRFAHLERKVYWHDEAYTSTVITARPGKYLTDELFQNRLVKPTDLLAYQRFQPNLTLQDMLVRKGTEDVQHPPLYYVLLRFWAQWWGTEPKIIRSFSTLLSLLLFPALYWLCLELFESPLSGWVAIALFAVSPFHLVYSQEAREFSFWTVLILVSSALLLRATRSPTWRSWVWYGGSMLLACYTGLFSFGVVIGHLVYVRGLEGGDPRPLKLGRRTWNCLITLGLVALLFLPWIYFLVVARNQFKATTGWTALSLPWWEQSQAIALNFSRSFVDFNLEPSNLLAYVLALPILLLQGYALFVLCRTTPGRVWWFILTLVGSTALLLGVPDLLLGGQRFTVPRYPIACSLGLQLAVVSLLTSYLTQKQRWKVKFAKLVLGLLILLGLLSCGVYAQANTWWNKEVNTYYHEVAELINRSDRPLIIADSYSYYPVSLVALSYLLKPDTQMLLLPSVGNSFEVKSLPTNAKTIFLFNLPDVFRQKFESWSGKKLTPAFYDRWNHIWSYPTVTKPD